MIVLKPLLRPFYVLVCVPLFLCKGAIIGNCRGRVDVMLREKFAMNCVHDNAFSKTACDVVCLDDILFVKALLLLNDMQDT